MKLNFFWIKILKLIKDSISLDIWQLKYFICQYSVPKGKDLAVKYLI